MLERYVRIVKNPQGLVLFTGPTGSGKTTSLYSTIDYLRQASVKIVTAEDPVEYYFDGVQQCQVHEEIGNTFAAYLRSFLRGDPDVILVGEIRDADTVEFAVRAVLTGHLVFSTLHTSDTIGSIPRLLSMGIDPDLLRSSLLAVVSQRLVRTVCQTCGFKFHPSAELLETFYPGGPPPDAEFRIGKGCVACDETGYRGRTPLFEFWEVDEETKGMIHRGADESELWNKALASGTVTLIEDGLAKVERGMTTLDEIERCVPYRQIVLHRTRGAV